jgi:hypothetical protein
MAIRFEKLDVGTYKLTRNDGRSDPELLFSKRPKLKDTTFSLTDSPTDLRKEPHQFWTWTVAYSEAKDPDLKGLPIDVTALPVPEPGQGI